MTKRKDTQNESLAEIAIDPDVLAQELSVELEIDPLEPVSYTHLTLPTILRV